MSSSGLRDSLPLDHIHPTRGGKALKIKGSRLFLLGSSLVILLAACGGTSNETPAAPAALPAPPAAESPIQADPVEEFPRYQDYQIPIEFQRLVFAGGRDGSSATLFWIAASQLWNRELGMNTSVQASDGVANGLLLEAGEVLAAVNNPSALSTATGRSEPLDGTNIRTLWNMFSVTWTIVADPSLNAQKFSDLAGKRVVVGPGPETALFERALDCAGLTRDDFAAVLEVGKDEAIAAYRDGNADAMVGWLGPVPMGQATELVASQRGRGAVVIPPGDDIASCLSMTPYYNATVIPGGTYSGTDGDISTISEWFYAAVSDELPTELVYNMARVLNENFDELVAQFAGARTATAENTSTAIGFELHRGAREYLQDIGLMK